MTRFYEAPAKTLNQILCSIPILFCGKTSRINFRNPQLSIETKTSITRSINVNRASHEMDIAMLAATLVFLSPFIGAASYLAATSAQRSAHEQDSGVATEVARTNLLLFGDRLGLTKLLISAGVMTVVVLAACLVLPQDDFLFGVAFVWLLGALVIFDCLQRRLPNALTASLGVLGLAMAALNGVFVEAAIGVALGGVGPLLIKLAYRHYFHRSGFAERNVHVQRSTIATAETPGAP